MKKIYKIKTRIAVLLLACLITSTNAWAQLPMVRSTFNGPFVAITIGGGAISAAAAIGDDMTANTVPVGFTFNYLGTPYTTFNVCSNGWMNFGTTSITAANTNLYTTAAPNATLAPWWDDLSSSEVLYQTTGTAGSQICTIQWTSLSYYTGSTNTIRYQVKLFEGTDIIEFLYDVAPTGAISTAESASIGIKSATGGNGQYLDVVTGSCFTSNSTLQSTRWPAYNFRLTPGATSAIAGGAYNVGAGQTYRNLNEAAADINQRGISGAITLNLMDASNNITAAGGSNFFPILLGPITGSSSLNTLTINGNNNQVSYAGTTAGNIGNQASATAISGTTGEAIIGLVGADYVTINNVTISGGSAGNADQGIGIYNSSSTDGATNNIISNVVISMNRVNASSRGIALSVPTVPTSAAGSNSNNTFRNFSIENVYAGIQMTGNATFPDVNNVITNTVCTNFNTIGNPVTPNDIGNNTTQTYGIRATNQSSISISNNRVNNVTNTGGIVDGILIELFQGVSFLNNNIIQNIRNAGAGSTAIVSGVRATHTTTGTHSLRIYNNSISAITSGYAGVASATRTIKGIFIASAGGGTTGQDYQVYNNNVSINGSGSPNISNVCFEVGTTAGPIYTLGNNIFANYTVAQTGVARHFCMFSTSATLLGNIGTSSNNNDLYVANDQSTSGFVGLGNATTYATLANWQTAMTQDAASLSVDPMFINMTTDLHATAIGLNSTGMVPPAYIVADLDCATRTPDNDIGAYIINSCSGAPTAGSITGLSSICSGLGTTLNLIGATSGAGITYQWASSTISGGPYTNMGTTTTQATGPISTTTYYIVTTTCAFGSSVSTPEYTLTVNPNPIVAVTPTSGTVCQPAGSAVALVASGAISFGWGPAAGLSAVTGANVNALPTSTTTYTVIGTDAVGCTATATAAIAVTATPTITSVTATPSSVCSGGNSQLVASAVSSIATTVNNYIYATATGASLDPMTGSTSIVPSNTDDAPSTAQTIGFTFNFEGNNYTQFSASPDGWILLGGGAASNQFTNAVTSTLNIPKLYPYWDDLATGTTGNVTFVVTGTAPNRILKVQWFVTIPRATAGAANSTFQAWMYESSGLIEYRYGTMGAGAMTASVGATGVSTTPVNYQSITVTTNTSSNSVANDNVTGQPASGRTYSLTPPSNVLSYVWSPATFLSSTTIANPMATGVTSTTTYSVTVSAGTCSSAPSSVTVTAGSALTSTSNITPSAAVCVGTTVAFNSVPAGGGSPYTYAWSGPNSFTSTLQNPTLLTTALAAGAYTVTVTDNCSATSSSTVTLTVNGLPTLAVSPSSGSYCNPGGTAVALAASGTSTSYAWLPAAGLSATTGASVNASPTATTTYTVTGTDGNGCANTATAVITTSLAVTISSATATPSAVCIGGNSNLASTASFVTSAYCAAGATSTSFEKISNVTFGTINNTSAATAGYENFTAISTNITAGVSTPISIGISGAYATDDRIHIWVDMNGDGIFSDPAENVMNAAISTFCPACAGTNTVVTGNITIPITAINGSTRIRVRLEDQSAGGNLTPCGNSTYGQVEDYTLNISGGITNTISYAWSPATYLSSTTLSNPAATAIASSVTYTLTATSTLGCSSQSTVAITANPNPIATATSTPVLCNGGTSTVTVSATSGTPAYTGTGSFTQSAGTTVYTVTDVNSCTSTASVVVTQPTAIAVSSSATTVVCSGGTSTVTITATGGTGALTGTGTFTQSAGTTVYTVTDANSCTGTTSVLVTEPTAIAVTPTSSAVLCNGGTSTVTIAATGGTGALTGTGTFTQAAGTTVYTVTDANSCTGTATVVVTEPTTLVASSSSTAILCNGGTATVTVTASGGTPSYTGTGSFTQVFGSNTYTVTDGNGCTATTTATLSEPTAIVISYSETGILCNGGTSAVTIVATGGTPGYLGQGTFTQAAGATSYTITDANACSASLGVTVIEPPVLTTTSSITSAILCNGGTGMVDVVASGGTTPYIGDGSMSQSAGTTNYIVTDANGCTSSTNVTLTEPTAVMIMSSSTPILCNGGTSTVTITGMDGTPGYTGEGTFVQSAGTTTYTITDANGCVGAANVAVTEPAAIASTQTANLCNGTTITVGANTYSSAGTYTDIFPAFNACDSTVTTVVTTGTVDATTTTSGAVITANSSTGSYLWLDCNAASAPIAGGIETNQSYTSIANGDYAVQVTDNGCVDTSACVNINATGISNNSNNTLLVYPNPTTGMFNVVISNANISELLINIVDIQGKEVFSSEDKNVNGTFNKQINLEELSKGLYYIKVSTGAEVKIQKLIIQ